MSGALPVLGVARERMSKQERRAVTKNKEEQAAWNGFMQRVGGCHDIRGARKGE
ncbi:hypothetical protein HXT36_03335 [Gardnerella sp. DNF01144]|uniref:hypothetical protein n=1 Tax=Gardnerella sp. DNF01144 TaxID=2749058 RepID=UPI003BAD6CC7